MSKTVIDADTGQQIPTVDKYQQREYENEIAALAYPAKLNGGMKRLLVVKLYTMHRAYNEASRKVDQEKVGLVIMPLKKAPKEVRQLIRKLELAKKLVKTHTEALELTGYSQSYLAGDIYRKSSEAEMKRAKEKHEAAKQKLNDQYKAECFAFEQLVKEFAAEQIKKEREKLDQALVAKLDAIGPKLLPAHTEEAIQ